LLEEEARAGSEAGSCFGRTWNYRATWAVCASALKAEREIGPNWRLTGVASIGVGGNVGGYGTGQLGLGWLSSANSDSAWRYGAEVSIGAAGGGDVQVGNGLIGQAQLQARYMLSRAWALQADAGVLRSRYGELSTPFVGLLAVYSFSRPQRRN
jgi:hypothetical protein